MNRREARVAVQVICAIVPILGLTQLKGENLTTASELGPGDLITIRALHVPEIGKEPIRLAENGKLELPMIGSMQAVGLTPLQLATEIRNRLEPFVREPEVAVELVEVKSRPVSVMGAVKSPGVYQLTAPKRLLEVLAGAGGVEEAAGSVIHISRSRAQGPIALKGATESTDYYAAQVSLPELVEGRHPEWNIVIKANDVITVPRAKLVYVIGEVRKSGGFVLRERENMSVLQAISMAEGLTPTAGSKNAKILRPSSEGGPKTEVAVNVKDILAGKSADVPLRPNDILFVPNSASKNAALRGLESAIQIGTGVVIWHR
jgi:polysaccharide export outer membrane protein